MFGSSIGIFIFVYVATALLRSAVEVEIFRQEKRGLGKCHTLLSITLAVYLGFGCITIAGLMLLFSSYDGGY